MNISFVAVDPPRANYLGIWVCKRFFGADADPHVVVKVVKFVEDGVTDERIRKMFVRVFILVDVLQVVVEVDGDGGPIGITESGGALG